MGVLTVSAVARSRGRTLANGLPDNEFVQLMMQK
jgi:hypothetical protein